MAENILVGRHVQFACRNSGPRYLMRLFDYRDDTTSLESRGSDGETVIACGADALPAGYAARWL